MAVSCGLVAACGATPTTAPQRPVVVVPGDAAVDSERPRGLVATATKRHMIEAPHGGEIRLLALTPDGNSALSCDDFGGIRLWPTLDGTHEPRVVELPDPKHLAIARHGSGYLAAEIDDAGSLMFAELDEAGLVHARATIDGDPDFIGLEMTELGALAWRSDHTISLFGDDGVAKSALGTEPGQRLVDVAVRGRSAIAIVETLVADKLEKRGREIVLEPKLAWGRTIAAAKPSVGAIALSPSGKRLAMAAQAAPEKPVRDVVIELATGKVIADESIDGASKLGFIDEDHLAIAAPGGVSWLDLAAPKPVYHPAELTSSGSVVLAVGVGRAVTKQNGELVLQTPVENRYLGYALASPMIAATAPAGRLLVGSADGFTLLGADLRADPGTVPELPKNVNTYQLRWLGGADWAAEVARTTDGITSLILLGSDGAPPQTVRTNNLHSIQPILYEPSTRLLTLSLGDNPEILRYDPTRRRIDPVASVSKPKGFAQIELVPVSPALAGGAKLVKLTIKEQTTVEWMTDDKASARAATATIDSFANADAAGRVYAWNNHPPGELVLEVFTNGVHTGSLPHDGSVSLWPEPAAKRVLEIGQQEVSLHETDGKLVWTQSIASVNEALWLTDGAIALVTAAGIARLDAATGSVTAARCGWKFGLSAKPHPAAARIEPVCTQLER